MASNLIDIPWLKIGRHFNVHDSKAVHNKLFTNVMIKKCDGSESVCFSDARIKFETGWSVFLSLFWHESLFNLLDKIVNEVKSTEDDLYEILTNFIQKDDHKHCLQKLNNTLSEAETLSILTHHLFGPLVPSSKYMIDGRHRHEKKCFACKENIVLGNTSFGHIDVWHGYADILVEKSSVKVIQVSSDGDASESDGEPVKKKMKDGDGEPRQQRSSEGDGQPCQQRSSDGDGEPHQQRSSDGDGEPRQQRSSEGDDTSEEAIDLSDTMSVEETVMNEALLHVFAQSIVNAFCEVKKNPKLEDYYIPSFLATATTVSVHMYNCKRDRLFSSVDLPIFDDSGEELNFGTIVIIWLSLNFDRLANIIPDGELEERGNPRCNFKSAVGDSYKLYQTELSKPLKDANKKRPVTRQFDMAMWFQNTQFLSDLKDSLGRTQALVDNFKMIGANQSKLP